MKKIEMLDQSLYPRSVVRLAQMLVMAIALFYLPQASAVQACDTDIVKSPTGPICGFTHQLSDQSAEVFLGIPFGQDTGGPARFNPPQAVADWSKTFEATSFGDICPQPLPPGADAKVMSENCLNLNVWRPKHAKPGSDLAVMVFIYGGAFLMGDNRYGLYDGAYLAAHQDVIVVNLNYRLGSFGFLVNGEVTGNMGISDQQLALKWVARNIRAFGGAPDKVTLFGQSAGAMSVGLHTFVMPSSQSLFRAAIMESNVLGVPFKLPRQQAHVSDLLSVVLGCFDVVCLRDIPMEQILKAQTDIYASLKKIFGTLPYFVPFGPIVDGALIQDLPMNVVNNGRFKPVLLGSNRTDAKLFVGEAPLSNADLIIYSANAFGSAFKSVIERYPPANSKANLATWTEIETDYLLRCPAQLVAGSLDSPAYLYQFNHTPSFPVWGGKMCEQKGVVCHGAELPFVFHTAAEIGGKFTEQEKQLSEQMMAYWTNFAKYLDPNGPREAGDKSASDLLKWPAANVGPTAQQLSLSTPTRVVEVQTNDRVCSFWASVGYDLSDPWHDLLNTRSSHESLKR